MPLDLPAPVAAFFAADAAQDVETLALCFAEDGAVTDESATHAGRPAIRAWWRQAHDRYRFRNDPLEAAEAGGRLLVRARVSGDFPGAPAILRFAFDLDAGLIRRLEIA